MAPGENEAKMKPISNFVNLENLRSGIDEFRSQWPTETDFHNAFYYRLASYTDIARHWTALVDDLWDWKAIRPQSKAEILEGGRQRLVELQNERTKILQRYNRHELDLSVAGWGDIESLFTLAGIKRN